MRSKTFQRVLNNMEKNPWWTKLKRWFIVEVQTEVQTTRFEKWEDAIPFLGKPIIVSFIEKPDIKGILSGISLVMDGDKIITAFLEVKNDKWEYWKCKA